MASLKLATIGLAAAALFLLSPTSAARGQEETEPVGQQQEEDEAPAPQPRVPQAESGEGREHRRDGFVIGLNLGGGVAEPEVTLSGGRRVTGNRELGVAANLRVGYAARNNVVVGIEGLGWFKSYTIFETETGEKFDADVSYSTAGLFVHVFPLGGFFVRGVVGWGWAAVNPRNLESVHDEGIGWTAGLGYQLRATKTIALGLVAEYGTIGVDRQKTLDALGETIESDFTAASVNLTFGISWYL